MPCASRLSATPSCGSSGPARSRAPSSRALRRSSSAIASPSSVLSSIAWTARSTPTAMTMGTRTATSTKTTVPTMETTPMKPSQLRTRVLATGLLLCAASAIAQADLQQKINGSVRDVSRPQSDVATTMRSSGLAAVPEDFAGLKLAPGFLIAIKVLSDPDFDGAYRIDQQGDLALPVVGFLHVGG